MKFHYFIPIFIFLFSCDEEGIGPFTSADQRIISVTDYEHGIRKMVYAENGLSDVIFIDDSYYSIKNPKITVNERGYPDIVWVNFTDPEKRKMWFDFDFKRGKITHMQHFDITSDDHFPLPFEQLRYVYDDRNRLRTIYWENYKEEIQEYQLTYRIEFSYDDQGNAIWIEFKAEHSDFSSYSMLVEYDDKPNAYTSLPYLCPGYSEYFWQPASKNNPLKASYYRDNELYLEAHFDYEYNFKDLPVHVTRTLVNKDSLVSGPTDFLIMEYEVHD